MNQQRGALAVGELTREVVVGCFRIDGVHCDTAKLVFRTPPKPPSTEHGFKVPAELQRACDAARADFIKGGCVL